jgi:ParB family chromosome partitioning protein
MPETETYVRMDPRELVTDRNIRTHPGLDDDFVATIAEFGVLEPIVAVRCGNGRVRVRMGERRTLGAIKAGRPDVPVLIIGGERDDTAAAIERRLAQFVENEHRSGLTVADKARFVQEMLDLGVSEAEIRKRARVPRAELTAAAAAGRSKLATAAAERYEFLTLAQAAAIAEFDDTPDAVKALVAAAKQGEGSFSHTLQQARDNRAEAAAYETAKAELEAAGLTVADSRPEESGKLLSYLGLTEEQHRDCPGHAAWLCRVYIYDDAGTPGQEAAQENAGEDGYDEDEEKGYDEDGYDLEGEDGVYEEAPGTYRPARRTGRYGWRPSYFCADPDTYGHAGPSYGEPAAGRGPAKPAGQSAEDAAKASAERSRVLRYNKAWRSAEKVRRDWLTGFLTRTTAPDGATAMKDRAMVRGDFEVRRAMEHGHELAAQLLGLPQPEGHRWREHGADAAYEAASAGRKQVIALGVTLAAYEAQTGVHTWRNDSDSARFYLQALAEFGYTLSPVEQYAVDGTDF